MVETPVLYIAYARPEYARQSFDAIKAAKPKKLYFYSNIARADRPDEIRRNNEVRAMVNEVDWDCELRTYFRKDYVEIFPSLWSAIDWVFANEEQAIVIEEDAVATNGFFEYCEFMLEHYKDQKDVWLISGNNFTPEYSPKNLDVFFSRYAGIWGWAGWRDRWEKMDRRMTSYPTEGKKVLIEYFGSRVQAWQMGKRLESTYLKAQIDGPWDLIFWYNVMVNNGKFVRPSRPLVTNVETYGTNHNPNAYLRKSIIKATICEHFPINKLPSTIQFCNSYDNRYFIKIRLLGTMKRKCSIIINKLKNKLKLF